MQALFAGTLFLSAALLFCVQPMVAKMVLPLLGGSPSVWNTCMVFFQAALLGGYLYAHTVTTWMKLRAQILVHVVVLSLPLLVLPIARPAEGPGDAEPVTWMLRLLVITVGLPFFAVATSAPLLQKWFAQSGHARAADPYFLYAASNLGSMVTLLGYPLMLEPSFSLVEQSRFWQFGYIALLGLVVVCGATVWRAAPAGIEKISTASEPDTNEPLTIGRRLRWIVLAFVPSSLMLGVTTYITTDIASIPFLWVTPLALYLLSFILVFSSWQPALGKWMTRILPFPAVLVAITLVGEAALPVGLLIGLHWFMLFVGAMVCHGELARDRPSTRHLTEFYLWMSFGGVLGGIANALLAPLLFRGGIYEYPLVLVLACWLRPGPSLRQSSSLNRWLDLILPAGLAILALGLVVGGQWIGLPMTDLESGFRERMFLLGIVAFACYSFVERPLRFALGLGVLMLTLSTTLRSGGRNLEVERNFFGVVRVQDDRAGRLRQLIHGNTIHGIQRLLPDGSPDPQCEPLSYYHQTGPIGHVLKEVNKRPDAKRIAIAGLGIGVLAYYARPDQDWTYYEIDPAIEPLARNKKYFTFLNDCKAAQMKVIKGDARLKMQEATEPFDLIIIDAFSSDAVPVHLLSRQALELYLSKLTPHGIIAFHISNRYLDLEPVLANLAHAVRPPLVCFAREDLQLDPAEKEAGKKESRWAVLTRSADNLGLLAHNSCWQQLQGDPARRVWTDDFSNMLEVLKK